MDIGYFDISDYIAITICAISIPTLIIRLLRAFPYYVKNGGLGHKDNTIWLGNDVSFRNQVINFFTETHPSAVLTDTLGLSLGGLLLYMAWGFVPFILFGILMFYSIRKFARYMRDQHVKKEEFHTALRGD